MGWSNAYQWLGNIKKKYFFRQTIFGEGNRQGEMKGIVKVELATKRGADWERLCCRAEVRVVTVCFYDKGLCSRYVITAVMIKSFVWKHPLCFPKLSGRREIEI